MKHTPLKMRRIAAGAVIIFIVAVGLNEFSSNGKGTAVSEDNFDGEWPFSEKSGELFCKNIGNGRKAVWLSARDYNYALNGPAMTMPWSKRAELTENAGGRWKIGREFANNMSGLSKLIKAGLKLCD